MDIQTDIRVDIQVNSHRAMISVWMSAPSDHSYVCPYGYPCRSPCRIIRTTDSSTRVVRLELKCVALFGPACLNWLLKLSPAGPFQSRSEFSELRAYIKRKDISGGRLFYEAPRLKINLDSLVTKLQGPLFLMRAVRGTS